MGSGLARGYVKAGHDIILGSRNLERARSVPSRIRGAVRGGLWNEAARDVELVVLAVPFRGAAGTVRPLVDAIAGKVVVDITNPFGAVSSGQIAGIEQNAKSAPTARWVAAYKTTFWKTLEEPALADGRRRDGLVCADDEEAKRTVIQLVEQTGFRAVDCGGLENARTLDLMVPLMIELDGRYGLNALSSWKFLDEIDEL